ncbi:MAG: S1 RNA-binding domain-containing protein, partial [Azoarcus sp.]|nr:S1 RNA-binding domain-containing protein [Azoarcus sp.]
RYVKDPHSVVKAGQVVKVKVLEVDLPRKRIALTMRLADEARPRRADAARAPEARLDAGNRSAPRTGSRPPPAAENALALAFARARNK